MSLSGLPPLPPTLRQVEHYLRTAKLYEHTNIVVCYWNLYLGVQEGMKLDRTSSAAHNFLASTLTLLEKMKEDNPKNDALTNQAAARSHIETEADRMYKYAHSQELAGASEVELVESYGTSGFLFDLLSAWGVVKDNVKAMGHYAKQKAMDIRNRLKKKIVQAEKQSPQVDRHSKPLTGLNFDEARKYMRYSLSALDYDDAKTSIENMHKAIELLQKR